MESRVRETDHEVHATRSCLKELEIELRDKELKVYEMADILDKLSVKNVDNEGEKNQLKEYVTTYHSRYWDTQKGNHHSVLMEKTIEIKIKLNNILRWT